MDDEPGPVDHLMAPEPSGCYLGMGDAVAKRRAAWEIEEQVHLVDQFGPRDLLKIIPVLAQQD